MTVRDRASLISEANADIPDNVAGLVSPADVRKSIVDLADSARLAQDLGDSATRNVGTTAGTVAAGDDSRIVASVPNTRQVTAGTGLTGGGALSSNQSIALSAASIASLAKADSALQAAAIGSTVQGYDANTAKLNVGQTFTQPQRFSRIAQDVTAVAALALDCSNRNEFTKTIAANSTFTVTNVPTGVAYHLRLILTYTSGTITWWSGVKWVGGTAPTFTGGKVYELIFSTNDGGTNWYVASGEYTP
jgi:hypothetical protein